MNRIYRSQKGGLGSTKINIIVSRNSKREAVHQNPNSYDNETSEEAPWTHTKTNLNYGAWWKQLSRRTSIQMHNWMHNFSQAPEDSRLIPADCSDQTGFGDVGSYVVDFLDVWPNGVFHWVHAGDEGDQWQKSITSSQTYCGIPLNCHTWISHLPAYCTRESPRSSRHTDTLWCWLSSNLQRCKVAWCRSHLKPHQTL